MKLYDKLNVVIPMAGAGKRFKEAGYKLPKPFIDVNGHPMITRVIDSLKSIMDSYEEVNLILLAQKEHITKYGLMELVEKYIGPNVVPIFIPIEGITGGAACTALLAEKYIDNDDALLIVNSDQLVKFNCDNFHIAKEMTDAMIFVFHAKDPKWSFVRVDGAFIKEVREKTPISDIATCGLYYYSRGSDFVEAAHEMIDRKDTFNGEFYIAPTYNYAEWTYPIPFYVDEMHGLGTPEDLKLYLENVKHA